MGTSRCAFGADDGGDEESARAGMEFFPGFLSTLCVAGVAGGPARPVCREAADLEASTGMSGNDVVSADERAVDRVTRAGNWVGRTGEDHISSESEYITRAAVTGGGAVFFMARVTARGTNAGSTLATPSSRLRRMLTGGSCDEVADTLVALNPWLLAGGLC
jgi:hypothetical protein